MLLDETVFIGRDNTIKLQLLEDGELFSTVYPDHPPTRFVVRIKDTLIDSDESPELFHWSTDDSVLEMAFGSVDLDSGKALSSLVIYSDLWLNGVVWVAPSRTLDQLRIVVLT